MFRINSKIKNVFKFIWSSKHLINNMFYKWNKEEIFLRPLRECPEPELGLD